MEASNSDKSTTTIRFEWWASLMCVILDCFNLTERLITAMEKVNDHNRDETIATIEEILEERAILLPMIKPPFTKEEIEVGKKIVLMNNTLQNLLNNQKKNIQKDINCLLNKKTSVNKYINPYHNMQTDGYFYDKRK
ncbi:flagellar protein FliT [Heyndrickxia vini]|uniref:Flagellar protein FliT n=1 Tax=Heyndrickxia vini TaxID=1476025 RepID=A0ABX7E3J2_9BACI|nr:flagellar protein FliT [Heyndrickxia vini]QQZ10284.1 flagellar protein FliT [Heyndrickxia vini]